MYTLDMNKEQILELIDEMEKEYYKVKPTSELALHPFRELKRRIEFKTDEDGKVEFTDSSGPIRVRAIRGDND